MSFFSMVQQPLVGAPLTEASRSHSFRHTTLGRISPGEQSAQRRYIYLTTNHTHNRQTSNPWRDSNLQS